MVERRAPVDSRRASTLEVGSREPGMGFPTGLVGSCAAIGGRRSTGRGVDCAPFKTANPRPPSPQPGYAPATGRRLNDPDSLSREPVHIEEDRNPDSRNGLPLLIQAFDGRTSF